MPKKNYKDFPENYFKVLEKFSKNGEDVVLRDNYAAVCYVRHDLHRFFKALSVASTEDRYAADLSNITRDIILVVEPTHAGREDPAKLILKMNPMTKAILQGSPG